MNQSTLPSLSQPVAVGLRVRVIRDQTKTRLGSPKFPCRTGTVERLNPYGLQRHGGLWYVRLEPTARGKERVETFWAAELVPEPPAQQTPASPPPTAELSASDMPA